MGKKQRDCPALGMSIPSARCGAERGVVIACPEDCVHNPFGRQNYDQFSEIESRTIQKLHRRGFDVGGDTGVRRLSRMIDEHKEQPFLLQAKSTRLFYGERDSAGQTFFDRWEAAGLPGLNNDERRVARWIGQMQLCLLELHRRLDASTVEAVDLFDADPRPLVLGDRGVAREFIRFATSLAWCYPAPHFWRTFAVHEIPRLKTMAPALMLAGTVAHLGGPAELTKARAWTAENIERVLNSFDAFVNAKMEEAIRRSDARIGRALYRWTREGAAIEVEERLRSVAPGIEENAVPRMEAIQGWTKAFDLVRPVEAAQSTGTSISSVPAQRDDPLIGSILLGPAGMLLTAATTAHFTELKRRAEAIAGDAVTLRAESLEDLSANLPERPTSPDTSLISPQLMALSEVHAQASTAPFFPASLGGEGAATLFREHYRGFVDRPLLELGDRTPRQAAADPAFRPRLVDLLKRHICSLDRVSQAKRAVLDLDPILGDLGLEEIRFPAPPLRDHADEEVEDGADDGFDDEPVSAFDELEWDYDPAQEEGPFAGRVLSQEEVGDRLETLLKLQSEQGYELATAWHEAWPGALELCIKLAAPTSAAEIPLLGYLFLQTAWLMHPTPPPGARIHPGRLRHYFEAETQRFRPPGGTATSPKDFPNFLEGTPQPNVLAWVLSHLLDQWDQPPSRGPRKMRGPLGVETTFHGICLLSAAVREFSHWPVK